MRVNGRGGRDNGDGDRMNRTCKILSNTSLTGDILRMTLGAETIAGECCPGQFVHLRVTSSIDPLLRRPFSIHRADPDAGVFEVLYRVIGRGTELMSRMKPEETIDAMGPLGNGFLLGGGFSEAVVVAGGMGSAPVFFLIDALLTMGKSVVFLWGARREEEFFRIEELRSRGVEVRLATDDGSKGHCGFVTELLETHLTALDDGTPRTGFACGPEPMLACVQRITRRTSFPWQASLEERMACGVGVCQGCAVRMRPESFRMVCSDGPVFDLREVVLVD